APEQRASRPDSASEFAGRRRAARGRAFRHHVPSGQDEGRCAGARARAHRIRDRRAGDRAALSDTTAMAPADPLVIKTLEFLGGMASVGGGRPEPALPEVAFAGRSNVGKSSLLNKLIRRRKFARVSNTPGR